MKKIPFLFLGMAIVIVIQSVLLSESKVDKYINKFFKNQVSVYKQFKRYNHEQATIVKNECRAMTSYNPPKTALGLSIVCNILLFIVSKRYNIKKWRKDSFIPSSFLV